MREVRVWDGALSAMWVTKADGRREPFDRGKVVESCVRMGATMEEAEAVAYKVERRVYDGIPTRGILQMIFQYLGKYRPCVRYQLDLRHAISLLRSQPDFERFVHILLIEHGYDVTPNRIIRGRCVEHEVDGIAKKGNDIILVEVKHHTNEHTLTGLDTPRIAQATLEDLVEGFHQGLNSTRFNKAMIVCNTKLSEHAKQYTSCRGIIHIGWKAPLGGGLERMVEERRLYPITVLRGLSRIEREMLVDAGVLLLRQLVDQEVDVLSERAGISRERLIELIARAEEILS